VAIATDVVQAGAGVAVVPEPNAIATGLRQLLAADASEYARMSANAAALARDKFSVEAMGRNLSFLYQSIAANPPISARMGEASS
jgi:glycosyltransferase involved in cell wall biosynthesis